MGNATKQIEQLQSGEKVYSCTMVLGATTPCYDLEQAVDHYYPTKQITKELIEEARQQFVGEIEQVPPMFSAVKVDGHRAYISARDGETVDIAQKRVTIYDFEITAFREGKATTFHNTGLKKQNSVLKVNERELYRNPQGVIPEGLPEIDFKICCGKGTYIRSIARDFGEALGSGAFLSALRRERIGKYSLTDAINIDDIETKITANNPTYCDIAELAKKC